MKNANLAEEMVTPHDVDHHDQLPGLKAALDPLVRGLALHVVGEVERLADTGCIEINLIAQDLCAYGKDLSPRQSLDQLLKALDRVAKERNSNVKKSHRKPARVSSPASKPSKPSASKPPRGGRNRRSRPRSSGWFISSKR